MIPRARLLAEHELMRAALAKFATMLECAETEADTSASASSGDPSRHDTRVAAHLLGTAWAMGVQMRQVLAMCSPEIDKPRSAPVVQLAPRPVARTTPQNAEQSIAALEASLEKGRAS